MKTLPIRKLQDACLFMCGFFMGAVVATAMVFTGLAFADDDPPAVLSYCVGPWTLGCESQTHTITVPPEHDTLENALETGAPPAGWKWFRHVSGPGGCLVVTTGDAQERITGGRTFPADDGSGKAGFIVQGYSAKVVVGPACRSLGLEPNCGLGSCY